MQCPCKYFSMVLLYNNCKFRPVLTGKFSFTEAKTIYMNNFKTDPETSKNTNIPMNF